MTKRMTIPPELEGEYTIRVMDMPVQTPGMVIYDDEDHANVYLNAHYNHESNAETADHELTHVIHDDIHNNDDIRTIEARADGDAAKLKSIPHLMKARDLLPPPQPKFTPSPHQLAVLQNCISELDRFLLDDRYEY